MEVLKRGFEILKTRPLNDKLDVDALEEEYNVKIPSSYRLFSELFYLNVEVSENDLTVRYLPEYNPLGDEIYFDDLFTLDFCLSSYEENDFWYEKGYMQIGDGPPDGGILLCMEGDDSDSVFFNNGNKYVKLASSIFDFFRDVVIVKNENV